jgi:hypothetical protein
MRPRTPPGGVLLALWLACCGAQAQQVCDLLSRAPSTPASRYADNGDGTLTDQELQLMWMRCSSGQQWAGGRCSGAASLHDWPSARAAAAQLNRDGSQFYNDWRLPSMRELATIAERQCSAPRVNLALFPDTPAAPYWTASARAGRPADDAAYTLDFGASGVQVLGKSEAAHLRLVRNAR